MSTLEIIAVVVGILAGTAGVAGFFLSIVSLWYQWNTTRPRLVVRPIVLGGPPILRWHGMMQVCNVGHVPVVWTRLGFQRAGRGGQASVLREATSITEIEDEPLEEIEPQHAAWVLFKLEEVPQVTEVGRAYAESMVGGTFKASRRDMRRFIKRLKEARLSPPLPAAPCTPPQGADTPA